MSLGRRAGVAVGAGSGRGSASGVIAFVRGGTHVGNGLAGEPAGND
jgi:hypothetical protein